MVPPPTPARLANVLLGDAPREQERQLHPASLDHAPDIDRPALVEGLLKVPEALLYWPDKRLVILDLEHLRLLEVLMIERHPLPFEGGVQHVVTRVRSLLPTHLPPPPVVVESGLS